MLNPRFLPLLLALGALVFAGCGGSDDKGSSSAADTAAATAADSTASDDTAVAPNNDDATAPAVSNATDLKHKPKIARPSGPTPSTLVKKDLVVGKGATVKEGDSITVEYVGLSFSNGQQFDTSWGRSPATFQLAQGQLIDGWVKGIPGMKVGGRRELVIPPDMGYGAQGQNGILPNETLVFVIDVKKIGA